MKGQPITFDYVPLVPYTGGKARKWAPTRPCQFCDRRFMPRVEDAGARFCCRLCANRALAKASHARALARQIPCAFCTTPFKPATVTRKFCSRACATKSRIAAHVKSKPVHAPRVRRAGETTDRNGLGPPICPTHPHIALAFGSDALTGRSLEYCASCGWRLLAQRGTRDYSATQERIDEMDAVVQSARAPVQQKFKHPRSRQQLGAANFSVIGSALSRKIHAA